MWLFLPFGFYSVVQKRPADPFLTVRVRGVADLDTLRERIPALGPTILGGGTDYPARATISHADFAAGMAAISASIDYGNFKSKVGAVEGNRRHDVYMRVWSVLRGLEAENVKPPGGK